MSRSSNASSKGTKNLGNLPRPYAPENGAAWKQLHREVLDEGLHRWPLPVPCHSFTSGRVREQEAAS